LRIEFGHKKLNHFIFVSLMFLYMPIVTVAMYSGRTQTEKDRLAETITDDVVRIWKLQKKDIIVVFEEAPHGNWFAGGVRL